MSGTFGCVLEGQVLLLCFCLSACGLSVICLPVASRYLSFINSLRSGAFPTVPYAKLADKTQRSTSSEMAAAKGRAPCGGIKLHLSRIKKGI